MKQQCLSCASELAQEIYAVYTGKEEEIAGFLCEQCRKQHKIKGLQNKNELQKLEKLKELLK